MDAVIVARVNGPPVSAATTRPRITAVPVDATFRESRGGVTCAGRGGVCAAAIDAKTIPTRTSPIAIGLVFMRVVMIAVLEGSRFRTITAAADPDCELR